MRYLRRVGVLQPNVVRQVGADGAGLLCLAPGFGAHSSPQTAAAHHSMPLHDYSHTSQSDSMPGAVKELSSSGQLLQAWTLSPDGELAPVGAATRATGIRQLLASAFLPLGYPDAVTADYAGFVVWNTAQAVSSYVRGVLCSHAVFRGVGVGSASASAMGAVWAFFVRDILGMAGGIWFAAAAGGGFDANAKQWRLFADVMNDLAMALDLASPLLPGGFMLLASLGAVARAMVGMAGGATHAALTQHFAAAGGNAADVSAKAESRERAASIVGSLLGMAVTHLLADNVVAAWAFFLLLTWLHVWANVRAMRALVLSSLNEPRLKLLLHHYEDKEKVLTPQQVSGLESLLVPPAAALLEWAASRPQCGVEFGARLAPLLCVGSRMPQGAVLQRLCEAQPPAAGRQYVLCLTGGRRRRCVHVVVHARADQQAQLAAYLTALHLAGTLQQAAAGDKRTGATDDTQLLAASQQWASKCLPQFLAALGQHGWQLDKLYLPRPQYTAEW